MIKTNSGKIFIVDFNDPKEEDNKTYYEYVYAVNEKHAKQIFLAANPGCIIKSIEYDNDAISQHYEEKSTIAEIALAERIMYAILAEMSNDKSVPVTTAQNTLDIAYHMAKMALKKVELADTTGGTTENPNEGA